MSALAAQKRARLQTIVAERATWASQVTQITRMHGWVLEVEHLLDESRAQPGEVVSNATVGSRLDTWREQMARLLTDGTLCELERECLSATTGRTFPGQTTTWSAAFVASRPSIAASVGARTGTRICCATGAAWRTRSGGSKMPAIATSWSCARPGSTALVGASCDGRRPSPTVSN